MSDEPKDGEKYIYLKSLRMMIISTHGQGRSAPVMVKNQPRAGQQDYQEQQQVSCTMTGSETAFEKRIRTDEAKDLWPLLPKNSLPSLDADVLSSDLARHQQHDIEEEIKEVQQLPDDNGTTTEQQTTNFNTDYNSCIGQELDDGLQISEKESPIDIQNEPKGSEAFSSIKRDISADNCHDLKEQSTDNSKHTDTSFQFFNYMYQDVEIIHQQVLTSFHLFQTTTKTTANQLAEVSQSVKAQWYKTCAFQSELSALFKNYEITIYQQLRFNNEESTKTEEKLRQEYQRRISLLRQDRESGRKFYWNQIGFYSKTLFLLEKGVQDRGLLQPLNNARELAAAYNTEINKANTISFSNASVSSVVTQSKVKVKKKSKLFGLFNSCMKAKNCSKKDKFSIHGKTLEAADVEKKQAEEIDTLRRRLDTVTRSHEQVVCQNEIMKQQLQEYEIRLQCKETEVEKLRKQLDDLNETVESSTVSLLPSRMSNAKVMVCRKVFDGSSSENTFIDNDATPLKDENENKHEADNFGINVCPSSSAEKCVHDMVSNMKSDIDQLLKKQMHVFEDFKDQETKLNSYICNAENEYLKLIANIKKVNEGLGNIGKSVFDRSNIKEDNIKTNDMQSTSTASYTKNCNAFARLSCQLKVCNDHVKFREVTNELDDTLDKLHEQLDDHKRSGGKLLIRPSMTEGKECGSQDSGYSEEENIVEELSSGEDDDAEKEDEFSMEHELLTGFFKNTAAKVRSEGRNRSVKETCTPEAANAFATYGSCTQAASSLSSDHQDADSVKPERLRQECTREQEGKESGNQDAGYSEKEHVVEESSSGKDDDAQMEDEFAMEHELLTGFFKNTAANVRSKGRHRSVNDTSKPETENEFTTYGNCAHFVLSASSGSQDVDSVKLESLKQECTIEQQPVLSNKDMHNSLGSQNDEKFRVDAAMEGGLIGSAEHNASSSLELNEGKYLPISRKPPPKPPRISIPAEKNIL